MNSRKFINSFDRTKFFNNERILEACKFLEITNRKEQFRMGEFLLFTKSLNCRLPFTKSQDEIPLPSEA